MANTESNNSVDQAFENVFIRNIHRSGTALMYFIFIVTLLPAMYLSFVKGYHPGWDVIGTAAVAMLGLEAIQWVIGPTIFFPMLGVTGTYLSCAAGNGMNMRIPATLAAQNAIGAKVGTKKSELAGLIGMAASVYVNLVFLVALILTSSWVISIVPPVIIEATDYVLPSIYGTLLYSFIKQANWKSVVVAAPVGAVLMLIGVPEAMQMPLAMLLGGVGCFAAGKLLVKNGKSLSIPK